ncbi:hypothetical protein EVG20_g2539 [Dentipellis fragilis]|uniref:Uncharacterized protein n=1 Tax=Dentipellis fragilis TaxID=205917 RepID=A0A4Y9Z6H8_9AGAM|nr:hypothetical protein EVG20_g2539 [Dentipellis fragilis]
MIRAAAMASPNAEERGAMDELFMERLEAFTEKTLSDISLGKISPKLYAVHSVLVATSRLLESLHATTGTHSFFVVVDPDKPDDDGFLGGTLVGREFWRGMRAGGANGARAFHAQAVSAAQGATLASGGTPTPAVSAAPSKLPSHQLKAEVYAGVRAALRATSGVRNADMKWTNHERLSTYGVRIEGWPPNVPLQNPSSLSMSQNRLLKDCLDRGTLKFHKLDDAGDTDQVNLAQGSDGTGGDISWAVADEPSASQADASQANRVNSTPQFTVSRDRVAQRETPSWSKLDPALRELSDVTMSFDPTVPLLQSEESRFPVDTEQDGSRKRKRDDIDGV